MHKTVETIAKSKTTNGQPSLHSVHISSEQLVTTDRHVLIREQFKTPIDNLNGELTIDPNGVPLNVNYPDTDRLIPTDDNIRYHLNIEAGKWVDIIQVYKKNMYAAINITDGIVTIAFGESSDDLSGEFEIGKSDNEDLTIYFQPKFLKMIGDYGKEVIGRNFKDSYFELEVVSRYEPAKVIFENDDITGTFLVTPLHVN
ncbi:hypothetical protein [Weissella paramesenteroides]|nr:hypothetical protein [Weissella paramesenteroides]